MPKLKTSPLRNTLRFFRSSCCPWREDGGKKAQFGIIVRHWVSSGGTCPPFGQNDDVLSSAFGRVDFACGDDHHLPLDEARRNRTMAPYQLDSIPWCSDFTWRYCAQYALVCSIRVSPCRRVSPSSGQHKSAYRHIAEFWTFRQRGKYPRIQPYAVSEYDGCDFQCGRWRAWKSSGNLVDEGSSPNRYPCCISSACVFVPPVKKGRLRQDK